MKIVFEKKELVALGEFIKEYSKSNQIILKEFLGQDEEDTKLTEDDVKEFLNDFIKAESNIYKARLGLTGLTIYLNPEFTVDILNAYGKMISACVHPTVAMIKAIQVTTEEISVVQQKWFDNEPDMSNIMDDVMEQLKTDKED
jgi:hypothetical protein